MSRALAACVNERERLRAASLATDCGVEFEALEATPAPMVFDGLVRARTGQPRRPCLWTVRYDPRDAAGCV